MVSTIFNLKYHEKINGIFASDRASRISGQF
jgi:hypothetical protein